MCAEMSVQWLAKGPVTIRACQGLPKPIPPGCVRGARALRLRREGSAITAQGQRGCGAKPNEGLWHGFSATQITMQQ